MKMEKLEVTIKGKQPILGSVSLDKEIFTKYIASKAKDNEKEKANADVENVIDGAEKTTGFYRDSKGRPIIKAYQIKGFMKESCKALKDQLGICSCVSKIDNFVFFVEDNINFKCNGKVVKDITGYLERPLRGETAQGPRVSLAKSERIDDWELTFTIKVLENKKTAKSVALTMDVVKEILSYGELKGLLQWRNAGYGSFEIVSMKEVK